jgi:hypothetical protein
VPRPATRQRARQRTAAKWCSPYLDKPSADRDPASHPGGSGTTAGSPNPTPGVWSIYDAICSTPMADHKLFSQLICSLSIAVTGGFERSPCKALIGSPRRSAVCQDWCVPVRYLPARYQQSRRAHGSVPQRYRVVLLAPLLANRRHNPRLGFWGLFSFAVPAFVPPVLGPLIEHVAHALPERTQRRLEVALCGK